MKIVMDEPRYYADITAKFKDSNSTIRFSDFKSKKKGSTMVQLFSGLVVAGYQSIAKEKIQEWWDKGAIQRNITRLREMHSDSEGTKGLTRTGALRVYKVVIEKLTPQQLSGVIISHDNFTRKELGIGDASK